MTAYTGNDSEVTVPSGITAIGARAFSPREYDKEIHVTKVTLPEGIKTIGRAAFDGQMELLEINFPEGLERIGAYAFGSTGLSNLNFPSTLHWIEEGAFESCNGLTELIIPEGVIDIQRIAFTLCDNLRNIYLPRSLEPGEYDVSFGETATLWVWRNSPSDIFYSAIGSFTVKYRDEDNGLSLIFSPSTAKPGDSVTASLEKYGEIPFTGISFSFEFDEEVLEYEDYTETGLTGWDVDFVSSKDPSGKNGIISVDWSGTDATSFAGDVLRLNFRVADDADNGSVYLEEGEYQVTGADGNELSAEFNIGSLTVYVTPPVTVESVTINPSGSVRLAVGSSQQLTATVLPADADQVVTWSSSDPDAVSVDGTGLITLLGEGTVTITVASVADDTKTAQITVLEPADNGDINNNNNNGAVRLWTLDIPGAVLPHTGFSSVRPQALSAMPKNLSYAPFGKTLQIPSLSVEAEIVTVPLADGEYHIDWLGDKAGALEGMAMPGEGHSVIVAHNHLNTTEIGPFAFLSWMEEGQRILIVDAEGNKQIYSVYANEKVDEAGFEAVAEIAAQYDTTITMLTCEDERIEGGYANRRIVAAKLLGE